jgi:hypothetical protein
MSTIADVILGVLKDASVKRISGSQWWWWKGG